MNYWQTYEGGEGGEGFEQRRSCRGKEILLVVWASFDLRYTIDDLRFKILIFDLLVAIAISLGNVSAILLPKQKS